jgi:hypothetical protein
MARSRPISKSQCTVQHPYQPGKPAPATIATIHDDKGSVCISFLTISCPFLMFAHRPHREGRPTFGAAATTAPASIMCNAEFSDSRHTCLVSNVCVVSCKVLFFFCKGTTQIIPLPPPDLSPPHHHAPPLIPLTCNAPPPLSPLLCRTSDSLLLAQGDGGMPGRNPVRQHRARVCRTVRHPSQMQESGRVYVEPETHHLLPNPRGCNRSKHRHVVCTGCAVVQLCLFSQSACLF